MSAAPATYSLVIATLDRRMNSPWTLSEVETQTHRPSEVIVVDSSRNENSRPNLRGVGGPTTASVDILRS
jgi:hypothetical protein